MASTRDFQQKISSLQNMQKVMKAMNMISTVKLRKLIMGLDALKLFEENLVQSRSILQQLAATSENPLVGSEKTVRKTHIILFTSDKGLCGSYNNAILKELDVLIWKNRMNTIGTELTCIGKKGAAYAQRNGYTVSFSTEIHENAFSMERLVQLSSEIIERVLSSEIQEVYILYTRFVSTISQEIVTRQIFPLNGKMETQKEKKEQLISYEISELPQDEIIQTASRFIFQQTLHLALRFSLLSENASRMSAMENASSNAKEMINLNIVLQNKARQTSITNELIEIISGKEALKGKQA